MSVPELLADLTGRARSRPPKGRNETAYWWRRHDEYDKP